MKHYTHPDMSVLLTASDDLLTTSGGGLTLSGFTLGEADGVGDLTEWKG